MRYRADAAQPLHHHRHFPIRPALDEFLEAAKFDDVQAHLMHVVVFVEQQRDLAVTFDARDRFDGDAAQGFGMGGGFEFAVHDGLSHRGFSHMQSTLRPAWACARRAGR
jgi:hypothetical protein